jgi:hypothetical protein
VGHRPLWPWVSARRILCSRIYRDRSGGPVRLKKASTTHIEMQIPVIIVVLNPRSSLIASTLKSFSIEGAPWYMGLGLHSIGTVVPLGGLRYTPKSGIFSSASLKRLVKFATQTTRVSSTIWPSS